MGAGYDIGLVIRAQAGDREALRQLLGAVAPPLRRYLARIAPAGADDMLQETLFRIWRNLGWLREAALFRAWAYRIATREALRAIRRERKHEALRADASELDELAAPFRDPAARSDLERVLARITPLTRAVLVAHYFEELTLEETAAAMETPLGTVKSRLASALKQARSVLEAAS